MRSLPIIALVLTSASPALATESPLDPDSRRCARVLPMLTADDAVAEQPDVASPDEPLLYKAVEHRIAGCPVLVMHRTGELRRVPEVNQRRRLFVPAR